MASMPMGKPQTINRNDIIVPKTGGNYMEVRHLVLAGQNRELGAALGDYAHHNLGVEKLGSYRDPIYGRAREKYLRHNFPALHERSLGVADAFRLRAGDTRFDTTAIPFDFGSFGCSAVFFPPEITANGHPLVARNLDFYTTSAASMATGKSTPSDPDLFSRSFIAELYPESEFASMQTTGPDLLNFPIDGINEHGLFSTLLVDQQGPDEADPFAGGQDSGLSGMQVIALLMNRCETVEEAKMVLLQNRIFMPFEASHWLIADGHGSSTIFEIDGKSGQYYFTDNEPGQAQQVTNHAIHVYPTVDTFPSVDPKASYNSFNRYRVLLDAMNRHPGTYSVDDCFDIVAKVFGRSNDAEEIGAKSPFPIRTLWTFVADLTDKTFSIKYYLKDDPATKGDVYLKLEMTDPMLMKLAA